MERVTIHIGNTTITVDRDYINVSYYDGATHKVRLNRQNMSYLENSSYLHDVRQAVAVWEQFFGKVETLSI